MATANQPRTPAPAPVRRLRPSPGSEGSVPARPRQLRLIEEAKRDWRLDEATRRRGLRGLEEARQALRRSRAA